VRKLNPLLGEGLVSKGARAYDAEKIVTLYYAVRNLSEMQRQTGIHRTTIRRYLAERGVKRLRLKCTAERCKQIGDTKRGCTHTEETKRKISAAEKGKKHWNWQEGKSAVIKVPCSFCGGLVKRGKHIVAQENQICCSSTKCRAELTRQSLGGDRHWNWQGGITKFRNQLRNSERYTNWRNAVYARDNYTCRECGCRGQMEAHHLISFSTILRENKIKTMRQAQQCKKLWDVRNGLTLCLACHKETDTYLCGVSA